MDCSTSSILVLHHLPELAQSIELVMPSNHLILCYPLLLLPSIFPNSRVFSNESALHIKGSKCWSLSFRISPSNKYSGLISFRTNRFDFLAVQETLKSLLQEHNMKASILQCSAIFMVQLSHPKGKGKGEKERYTHLNAEFQKIPRGSNKAFLSEQCKEIEENNRMGKIRDLFKKIRGTKGTFYAKMDTKRTEMVWT